MSFSQPRLRNEILYFNDQQSCDYLPAAGLPLSHCLLHPTKTDSAKIQFSQLAVTFYTTSFFCLFLAGASSPGGWSRAPCCAMSKCSPAFFSMAFCNISTTSVAAKLGCNAIRRTDHLKFPVPIMASAPVPPAWKILIQNKTVRQVLGKLASQSQFRGKLGS